MKTTELFQFKLRSAYCIALQEFIQEQNIGSSNDTDEATRVIDELGYPGAEYWLLQCKSARCHQSNRFVKKKIQLAQQFHYKKIPALDN